MTQTYSSIRFILFVFTFISFRILDVTQLCDTLTTIDAKRLGMRLYAKKYLADFPFGKYQITAPRLLAKGITTMPYMYDEIP